MYTQNGYKAGSELEDAGEFPNQKLEGPLPCLSLLGRKPTLHRTQSSDRDSSPETMFKKIQSWITDFEPKRNINRTIRMGIAKDYPFLPRATPLS